MLKICIMYQKVYYQNKEKIINENLQRTELYKILFEMGRKKGIEFFFSTYGDFRGGLVRRAVIFDGMWKVVKNRKFDMVFDKTDTTYQKEKEMVSKKFFMINNPSLSRILGDKYRFYKTFPQFSPKSFLVRNKKELAEIRKKIRTKKIVLKPTVGYGGKGVKITEKLPEKIRGETLVQEFITPKENSEFGKVWDTRVIIINGKIDHSYVRVAKKGSLLTNLHRGGTQIFIDKKKIPLSVRRVVRCVDKKFEKFGPRFYCLDFIIDRNNKPWVIEGNARPSVVDYFEPERRKRFFKRLLRFFKTSYESCKDKPFIY